MSNLSSLDNRPIEILPDRYRQIIASHIPNGIEIGFQLADMGFFDAPASTKYHGSYPGGLFDHSFNVTMSLVAITKQMGLVWERPESPWIIGLLHDLCKADQYNQTPAGYEWRKDTLFAGHGTKSVVLASTLLKLTEEEVACIVYHMGAFTEQEEWSNYTRAVHKYPNVLWTHTADMAAAHIKEIQDEWEGKKA